MRSPTSLLIASTGGHLKQLKQLENRLVGLADNRHWITFDTPQSRSLLAAEDVTFVPFVGGRDPLNVARNVPTAWRTLRRRSVVNLVSTGSAVAVPYFAAARLLGIDCYYIESAARSAGPSASARVIARVPGVNLRTQYPKWADDRWAFRGSVFDAFEAVPRGATTLEIQRVVVALGTYRGIGFRRLIERALAILPASAEVLWQTGQTDTSGLEIHAVTEIPERELTHAMHEADVVIAHAGVGTALAALECGKFPVLVPRRLAHGEHVDDHQVQIAEELARKDLSVSVDADDLTLDHLVVAASRAVRPLPDPPLIDLR